MECSTQQVQAEDGVSISVDWYREAGRDTILIICPGFFHSKQMSTIRRMSRMLIEEWDVLAMDFRGHGRSAGAYTFSAKESQDLDAVLTLARSRYSRIGLLGFSMGGAIAINTASRSPQSIVSLAAVSAPARFEDIDFRFWTPQALWSGLRGLGPGSGCRPGSPFLDKERPGERISHLVGPTLFIHGTRDVIIGVEHSRRLFAAAPEPKRLEIIDRGSHAEALFRDDPDGFSRLLQAWFRETLGR